MCFLLQSSRRNILFSCAYFTNSGLCHRVADSYIKEIHNQTTPQIKLTSDQPVEQAATCKTHNKGSKRTFIPSAVFVPMMATIELLQNYVWESTDTWTGRHKYWQLLIIWLNRHTHNYSIYCLQYLRRRVSIFYMIIFRSCHLIFGYSQPCFSLLHILINLCTSYL
jgi:hypothetical protein